MCLKDNRNTPLRVRVCEFNEVLNTILDFKVRYGFVSTKVEAIELPSGKWRVSVYPFRPVMRVSQKGEDYTYARV